MPEVSFSPILLALRHWRRSPFTAVGSMWTFSTKPAPQERKRGGVKRKGAPRLTGSEEGGPGSMQANRPSEKQKAPPKKIKEPWPFHPHLEAKPTQRIQNPNSSVHTQLLLGVVPNFRDAVEWGPEERT